MNEDPKDRARRILVQLLAEGGGPAHSDRVDWATEEGVWAFRRLRVKNRAVYHITPPAGSDIFINGEDVFSSIGEATACMAAAWASEYESQETQRLTRARGAVKRAAAPALAVIQIGLDKDGKWAKAVKKWEKMCGANLLVK